ncbi:hypothetical protein AAG906_006961 [Vitis piasezkii]
MKKWHDQLISNKEFQEGQRVLLYDTRLHIFPRKLKSRWIGLLIIHRVCPNRVVELLNSNGGRNFKEIERKKIGSKSEQNQSKNRGKTELYEISQNEENFCEMSIMLPNHSATLGTAKRITKRKNLISHQKFHSAGYFAIHSNINFAAKRIVKLSKMAFCRNWHFPPVIFFDQQRRPNFEWQMARTRGTKSSSPSNRKKSLRKEPPSDSTPSLRRQDQFLLGEARATKTTGKTIPYGRRSATQKRPRPSPVPSPYPHRHLQDLRGIFAIRSVPSPQEKSQSLKRHFSSPKFGEVAPEEVIRRPMLTQPPIEGNLDCRARPFHSELCFDIAAFQVRDPTLIHFTIDGRHGILGARHIAEALQIPYEPTQFDNFRAWTNPTELEMVRTLSRGAANRSHLPRGASSAYVSIDAFCVIISTHCKIRPKEGSPLRSSLQDVEGFSLGLIIRSGSPSLFQEKVHKRSLRVDCILSSFQGCYAKFGALGISFEPHLEKRICREPFTLNKWNNMTAYKVDQPEQPQPVARRASPRHIPEGITVAAPAIPRAPPAAPASSQPSTSTEPRMAIPISECRECSHPPEPQAPADAPTEEADPSA